MNWWTSSPPSGLAKAEVSDGLGEVYEYFLGRSPVLKAGADSSLHLPMW